LRILFAAQICRFLSKMMVLMEIYLLFDLLFKYSLILRQNVGFWLIIWNESMIFVQILDKQLKFNDFLTVFTVFTYLFLVVTVRMQIVINLTLIIIIRRKRDLYDSNIWRNYRNFNHSIRRSIRSFSMISNDVNLLNRILRVLLFLW